MRIYVASSNPGKLRDFAWAAAQMPGDIRLEPLPDLNGIPAPPEGEPTFEGNARAKALYYARQALQHDPSLAGQLILADDSGLEVEALDGAPGVRSARYADDAAFDLHSGAPIDYRNNALLLENLLRATSATRTARYRCALALSRAGVTPAIAAEADGTLTGEILRSPQGAGGFGYDPLFFIPEAGATMAELSPELRLHFSHRGRALRNLLTRLAQ